MESSKSADEEEESKRSDVYHRKVLASKKIVFDRLPPSRGKALLSWHRGSRRNASCCLLLPESPDGD